MITVLFVRTDRLSCINIRVIITSIISGIISGFVYLKSDNEVTVVATNLTALVVPYLFQDYSCYTLSIPLWVTTACLVSYFLTIYFGAVSPL